MQIVIDIPEDVYNRFTHNEVKPRCEITEEERFQMNADAVSLTRAFCNGTPLPKGHERLIDADAFVRRCMFDILITCDIKDMQDVIYALRDYKPIIEADKEV